MPCRSDEQEPNRIERKLSAVLCFLDELDGKSYTTSDLSGYRKDVYCRSPSIDKLDSKTAELCGRLSKMTQNKILQCSLELQIWWRDHQALDKKRKDEEAAKKEKELREEIKADATDILETYMKRLESQNYMKRLETLEAKVAALEAAKKISKARKR